MGALPSISLAELIARTAEFATPDDIYLLIAAGHLYVDLYAEPLAEPATVRVFRDRDASITYVKSPDRRAVEYSSPVSLQNFRAGATVTWDDRIWQVANVGIAMISLLGKDGEHSGVAPGSNGIAREEGPRYRRQNGVDAVPVSERPRSYRRLPLCGGAGCPVPPAAGSFD